MSDTGALSHVYTEWNVHLKNLNKWLLSIRKMQDGYIEPTPISVPDDVRVLLSKIAEALNPDAVHVTSPIPLSIQQRLLQRLDENIDAAHRLLERLSSAKQISPSDFSQEDIEFLSAILFSLDDEVTSLYNRIHRR